MALAMLVLAGCASTTTQEVSYDADSWRDVIPASCQNFFDGCNQCMRMPDSDDVGCTKMFCDTYAQPYCLDETVVDEIINTDPDSELIDRETEMEAQRAEAEQYAWEYIGLSVEEAEAFALEHNMSFRVVEEDGEGLAVTMDYRPGRINATVEDNIVVSVDVE